MKDNMILYTAYADKFKRLSDLQFGQLMRAALNYQQFGTEPDIDDLTVGLAFDVIKHDIDTNNQKYAETIEKKREAGRQGAESRWQNMADNSKNSTCHNDDSKNSTAISEMAKMADKDKVKDKDKDIKKDTPNGVSKEKTAKRFMPPTEAELLDYCLAKGLTIDAEAFMDFYASKGWKVGNQPMKDWQAAVRNWARRDKETARSGTSKPKSNLGVFADYKQTSTDDEWDEFSKLAGGGW